MTIFSYHAMANRLQRLGRPDDSVPTPPAKRFAGDPGVGKVMTGTVGGAGEGSDPIGWMTTNTGVFPLLDRMYFNIQPTTGGIWNHTQISASHANGNVPYISMKLGSDGWAQNNAASILAGNYDSAITADATWIKNQGYNVFACFYHEPEDNWTTAAQCTNYRAIFRHIITLFNAAGASNVTWGSIWMCPYTFSNGGENARGLAWYQWDADWKGTSSGSNGRPNASDFYTGSQQLCAVHGLDIYNPGLGGQTNYVEYGHNQDTAKNRMTADGKTWLPYLHGEWGTQAITSTTSPLPSDGWTGYYQRAFQRMAADLGVGFASWQNGSSSFVSGTDPAARLAGFKAALASEASYIVSSIPS